MSREEEIQKLIDEETGIDNYGSSDYQIGVCDGVRLADKTMINKACEIAKDILSSYSFANYPHEMQDFLVDFRKAMEK